MSRARVSPQEIDLVFAEGAALQESDALECTALTEVFGEKGPLVTCPKGAYGHLFGASAATEAVSGFMAMKTGRIPPIVGLERPDAGCEVRLVTEPVEHAVSTFLVSSRSREGVNVSLVMGRASA